jgi:hypothetical protein
MGGSPSWEGLPPYVFSRLRAIPDQARASKRITPSGPA